MGPKPWARMSLSLRRKCGLVATTLTGWQSKRISRSLLLVSSPDSARSRFPRRNRACFLYRKVSRTKHGRLAALGAIHPARPIRITRMQSEINGNAGGQRYPPNCDGSALRPPSGNQVVHTALCLLMKGPGELIEPPFMLPVRVQLLDTAASSRAKLTPEYQAGILSP